MSEAATPQTLILGIGNILWADEGFGVRAVEMLNRNYEAPEGVTLLDGGTQGIYLVSYVKAADYLVVFDAVDYGLAPGTLKVVEDDEVPSFMGAKKMSLHQTGFQEVLSMAQLLGSYPQRLLLVGVQPEELEDYGGSLRPCVKAQIEPAIRVAVDWLARLGVQLRRRARPLPESTLLASPQVGLDSYEAGRPSEEMAPRVGDPRVIFQQGCRFDPKPSPLEGPALGVDLDRRRQD
ncbi:MAG: HyaD/HybD family hydrogenase maturation endopeptidase [Chromatiales bacterium]|nr:HyaD/HybD family hydrogenase maturation endopeptidase [Chromatiales bacterium]